MESTNNEPCAMAWLAPILPEVAHPWGYDG